MHPFTGQHSEDPSDHKMNGDILDYMRQLPGGLDAALESQVKNHMAVIERFGRYPHRNQVHRYRYIQIYMCVS